MVFIRNVIPYNVFWPPLIFRLPGATPWRGFVKHRTGCMAYSCGMDPQIPPREQTWGLEPVVEFYINEVRVYRTMLNLRTSSNWNSSILWWGLQVNFQIACRFPTCCLPKIAVTQRVKVSTLPVRCRKAGEQGWIRQIWSGLPGRLAQMKKANTMLPPFCPRFITRINLPCGESGVCLDR
jgi:hypothetical protein